MRVFEGLRVFGQGKKLVGQMPDVRRLVACPRYFAQVQQFEQNFPKKYDICRVRLGTKPCSHKTENVGANG